MDKPNWSDSVAGLSGFLATPLGRAAKAPAVIVAFAAMWGVELVLLWLCVENFRSPMPVFLGFSALLFFWALASIWTSFYLIRHLWRAPLPSIALYADRFEFNAEDAKQSLEYSDVDRGSVRARPGGRGCHAACKPTHSEALVADLFDRPGFIDACRGIPALRLKVRQKLSGAAGNDDED